MDADVEARFGSLERQIVATRDEVHTRFEQVDSRIAALRDDMNARFEQVDARFGQVDARIREEGAQTRAHFDMMYEQMLGRLQLFAEETRAVAQRQDKITANHDGLVRRVERLEVRVDSLKRKRS